MEMTDQFVLATDESKEMIEDIDIEIHRFVENKIQKTIEAGFYFVCTSLRQFFFNEWRQQPRSVADDWGRGVDLKNKNFHFQETRRKGLKT